MLKRSDLPEFGLTLMPDGVRVFLFRGVGLAMASVAFEDAASRRGDGKTDILLRLPAELVKMVEWSTLSKCLPDENPAVST